MTSKKKGSCKKVLKSLSKNYWAVSTIILAVVLIAILAMGGIGSATATISSEAAGQKVADWASGQVEGVQVVSVTEEGGLYAVTFSYANPETDGTEEATLQITKDGENLILQAIPLAPQTAATQTPSQSTPTPTNIPQTDKPKVELFVMSHCPYGTQAEKGMLPVVGALGDTIDFDLKFVYYAMHPTQGEVEEQLNQYCIQEEQNAKFIPYLTCFLEAGDGAGCLTSEGIDKAKLSTCTTAIDAEFDVLANLEDTSSWLSGRFPMFNIHKAENDAYEIGGSPTLIINGVQAQAGRDSASYLGAICAAFSEAPEECNVELPSVQPGPGFGWSTTQAAATAATCG